MDHRTIGTGSLDMVDRVSIQGWLVEVGSRIDQTEFHVLGSFAHTIGKTNTNRSAFQRSRLDHHLLQPSFFTRLHGHVLRMREFPYARIKGGPRRRREQEQISTPHQVGKAKLSAVIGSDRWITEQLLPSGRVSVPKRSHKSRSDRIVFRVHNAA